MAKVSQGTLSPLSKQAVDLDAAFEEAALCEVPEVPWESETSKPFFVLGLPARRLGMGFAALAAVGLLWVAVLQFQKDTTAAIPKVSESSLQVADDMGVQQLLELFEDDVAPSMDHANSTFAKDLFAIKRHLQDMTQNPLALPIATCTVDVYLVASFIGIVGNVVNGAVKACERKSNFRKFVTLDRIEDLLKIDLLDERKRQALMRLLDQGCRIGVESSVALFSFIAAFLARAASDCAMSVKLPPNPGAQCAAAMSLISSGVSYLAAGAETAQATCPPYPGIIDPDPLVVAGVVDASAIDIVGGLARRLSIKDAIEKNPVAESKLDDARQIVLSRLPSLGPIGGFILNNKEYVKIRREQRKAKNRKDKEVKCGFDVAGLVGFAAAVGVFITAGTVECPLADGNTATADNFKMGCSMDISAVIAALTSIGGFVGILATECPANPSNAKDNLCATGSLNIVSALGFLSAALSDAPRSCGAALSELSSPS